MHQSKYGYLPCSYAEYRTIKAAHKTTLLSLRQALTYYRWSRKDPKNRHTAAPTTSLGTAAELQRDPSVKSLKAFYHKLLAALQQARRPQERPSDVKSLDLPKDWLARAIRLAGQERTHDESLAGR